MWIEIKKRLINLNNIEIIKWEDTGNDVFLYLYPPSNISAGNGRIDFHWAVKHKDGKCNDSVIDNLHIVNEELAKLTKTFQRIFKCDLADNSDDVIVQAVRDIGQRGEFIGE